MNTKFKRRTIACLTLLLIYLDGNSQQADSLINREEAGDKKHATAFIGTQARIDNGKFPTRAMVMPAVLTTYGFVALKNEGLELLDDHIRERVWDDQPHKPVHFDDGLQYVPGFSVYVLNGLGIQGKNNLLDATRQYFISSFMMMAIVQTIKKITGLKRPDGFGNNTFPSGHTSTAFVAAEFLSQEFKGRSAWYSIAGYTMATVVGYMRIYNNRHWFKDVVAGAGIGMGVTKFVYWVYPSIKRRFFKDKPGNTMVMPYYQRGAVGLSLIQNLREKAH